MEGTPLAFVMPVLVLVPMLVRCWCEQALNANGIEHQRH
jgi:hypothetical protein